MIWQVKSRFGMTPGDRRVRRDIHKSAKFQASLRGFARRAGFAAVKRGKVSVLPGCDFFQFLSLQRQFAGL